MARLNRTDAWFIGALTETRRRAKPMQLWEFINNADWLNRAVPSFEEAAASLPRLIAAGYAVASRDDKGRLVLRGTDAAFDLRARAKAGTLGGVLAELSGLVGAAPYPLPEQDDRSLGPLPLLERTEWNDAVRRNANWMESQIRRFIPGFRAPGSSRDIEQR